MPKFGTCGPRGSLGALGAMKTAVACVFLGLAMVAYSLTLTPYKNEAIFNERYMALESGQTKEYRALRNEMLSSKFPLQDYGGTAILFGVVVPFLYALRNKLKTPPIATVFLLALLAPAISVAAGLFDLFQGLERGEHPHWADSVGIPLSGIPMMAGSYFSWSILHLSFLIGGYTAGIPLIGGISKRSNPWLLLMLASIFLLLLLNVFSGTYWLSASGLVWLYYYLSLAAGRGSRNATQQIVQPDA